MAFAKVSLGGLKEGAHSHVVFFLDEEAGESVDGSGVCSMYSFNLFRC